MLDKFPLRLFGAEEDLLTKYKRRASSHCTSAINTAQQPPFDYISISTLRLPTMLTTTIISAILAFTPIALASPVEKRDPGNFRLFEHHYYQRTLISLLCSANTY
jgi:hypothetical protein